MLPKSSHWREDCRVSGEIVKNKGSWFKQSSTLPPCLYNYCYIHISFQICYIYFKYACLSQICKNEKTMCSVGKKLRKKVWFQASYVSMHVCIWMRKDRQKTSVNTQLFIFATTTKNIPIQDCCGIKHELLCHVMMYNIC